MTKLRDLTYEERLRQLNLPTLEHRRERDLIVLYDLLKQMEEVDKEGIITWDTRDSRDHGRKMKRTPVEGIIIRTAFHKEQ